MILERVPSIYFPRRVDNMALRINQIFHKRTTGFLPHDFPRQQARKVVLRACCLVDVSHTHTHTHQHHPQPSSFRVSELSTWHVVLIHYTPP